MSIREPAATTNLDTLSEAETLPWTRARDLEANPACTLSTSLTGIDLVFEGVAERVTDGPTLEALTAVWRDGGWPAEPTGDGIAAPYNAPATGSERLALSGSVAASSLCLRYNSVSCG